MPRPAVLPPPKPLTLKNRASVRLFLAKWQKALGMGDWRVVLSNRKSRELAHVECYLDDRLATVMLGNDFGALPVTSQTLEEVALHEILHAFLFELITTAAAGQDSASAEHRVINTLAKLLTNKEAE